MTLTPTGVWEVNGPKGVEAVGEGDDGGWLAGKEERRILPAADEQRQLATRGIEIEPRRRSKVKSTCPGDFP